MKKALLVAIIVFGLFVLINNVPGIKRAAGPAGDVLRPVKYARLLAQPPDEKINIPVRDVRVGQIADTWQAPRGADRTHQGQDIFARRGTPVYSATEGYVLRIGHNELGGNFVTVLGAGGRVYYYAHLERHAEGLMAGDHVTPESLIGYVGASGNAAGTPPHLHFGVYTMGGAIDPLSLF